jgi:hypothetical protein
MNLLDAVKGSHNLKSEFGKMILNQERIQLAYLLLEKRFLLQQF